MPEGTVPDPTDRGTQRPNAPPLQSKGDKFIPMDVSADDPITLFTLYYTPKIIESIVQHMNNTIRTAQDPSQPRARANAWYPTCTKEIYLFLAIRIYMMLFPMDEISDYWNSNKLFPQHEITKLMARDRCQELHMRYRVAPAGHKTLWDRVCI